MVAFALIVQINIVGVIAGDEIGFAHWIDLNYKGKSDQVTAPFYIYDDDKESFLKLCKELGIETYEYPVCAYCQKVMYGSHTLSEKGNQCFDCKDKEKNPQVCTNCGNRFNNPLADLCGSCFENG